MEQESARMRLSILFVLMSVLCLVTPAIYFREEEEQPREFSR